MKIKLLAVDMDGTAFYTAGPIVEANIEPIQQALELGVEVVAVTGRPVYSKFNQLEKNYFGTAERSLIAGCNGAIIYDVAKKEVIVTNPIKAEDALMIFNLRNRAEYQDIEISAYMNNSEDVVLAANEIVSKFVEFERSFLNDDFVRIETLPNDYDFTALKFMAYNVTDQFNQELIDLGFEVASHDGVSEINANGVNKAWAVDWLAQKEQLTPDEIMTIGDGANDLPMIEYATYGVAMKNSIPALKKIAKIYIDKTNEEGAVAEAIKKYIL